MIDGQAGNEPPLKEWTNSPFDRKKATVGAAGGGAERHNNYATRNHRNRKIFTYIILSGATVIDSGRKRNLLEFH